jgi:hypothetical protein
LTHLDSLQAVMLGEGGQKEKDDQTAFKYLEHEAGQWCAAGGGWEHEELHAGVLLPTAAPLAASQTSMHNTAEVASRCMYSTSLSS